MSQKAIVGDDDCVVRYGAAGGWGMPGLVTARHLSESIALAVRCTKCGAESFERCRSAGGARTQTHGARLEVAEEAMRRVRKL